MGDDFCISDDGTISFSFTIKQDADGELIPDIKCPFCDSEDVDLVGTESDTFHCEDCLTEFIPDEYKPLSSTQGYLKRASAMFKQERWKRVIKDCTAAIALDPDQEMSFFLRGRARYAREEFALAEKDLSESVRLSPNDQFNYYWRGLARFQLQRYPEAISDFTKSLKIKPDREVVRVRSVAYWKSGELDLALKGLSDLILLDPNNASRYVDRGCILRDKHELQAAIKDFTKALALEPENAIALIERSTTYELLGQYSLAIADLKAGLELAGTGLNVYQEQIDRLNHLTLLLDSGATSSIADQKSDTSQSESKDDSSIPYFEIRFSISFEREDWLKDHESQSRYLQQYPNDPIAIAHRGIRYSWDDDKENAMNDFVKAVSIDPGYALGYLYLGTAYTLDALHDDEGPNQREKFQKAVFYLSKAIELNPSILKAWAYRADAYENLGMIHEAIIDYQHYYDQGGGPEIPNMPGLLVKINDLKEQIGAEVVSDKSEEDPQPKFESDAEDNSELEDEPDGEEEVESEWLSEGLSLLKQKDYPQSIEFFSAAIEETPGLSDAYIYRASAHFLLNHHEEAVKDFETISTIEDTENETYWLLLSVLQYWDTETKMRSPIRKKFYEKMGVESGPALQTEAIKSIQTAIYIYQKMMAVFCCWQVMQFGGARQFQSAAELIDDYLEDRDPMLHGLLQAVIGNDRASLIILDKSISAFPEDKYLPWLRVFVNKESKIIEEEVEEAIKKIGRTPLSDRILILIAINNDAIEKASELLEKLEISPDDGELIKLLGVSARLRGYSDLAVKYLSIVIETDPDDSDCYYERGLAYRGLGDEDAAQVDLQRALEIVQKDGSMFVDEEIIQSAILNEERPDAETVEEPKEAPNFTIHAGPFEVPITVTPDEAARMATEAVAAIQMGLDDMAYEYISMAIAGDPTHADWYELRASILLRVEGNENDSRILADLTKAIELGSRMVRTYFVRASKLYSTDPETAKSDLASAIELDPSYPFAYSLRGSILLQEKRLDLAIEDLHKALELDRGQIKVIAPLLRNIMTFLNQDDYHQPDGLLLIKFFTNIITFSDFKQIGYMFRCYQFSAMNDGIASLSDWLMYHELEGSIDEEDAFRDICDENEPLPMICDSGIILEPEKNEVAENHLMEGARLFRENDTKGALKEFTIARGINPTDVRGYDFCFVILFQQGEWKAALRCISMLVQLKPDDAVVLGNRGVCHFKLGQIDDAIKYFQLAVEKDPAYGSGHLYLGTIYLTKQEYQKSIDALSKAIELDPTLQKAYAYRANAYENFGKLPQAISDYQHYYDHGGGPEISDLPGLLEHIKELKNQK